MFNQRSILILFINRNRFQLYGGSLTGVVTLDVPTSVVQDMEVLQKDGMYTLIKQWVKQYALVGTELFIVFSQSTYVEKIFLTNEHEQMERDILKFFETVPYESIWTKVYPADKGKRAVACNKTLYETIHQGFSLQGLPTKAVIPASALGVLSNKLALDAELIQYILKNLDSLTRQSLLDIQELGFTAPVESKEPTSPSKKGNSLPMLLGVFGVLIAILIIMVVIHLH